MRAPLTATGVELKTSPSPPPLTCMNPGRTQMARRKTPPKHVSDTGEPRYRSDSAHCNSMTSACRLRRRRGSARRSYALCHLASGTLIHHHCCCLLPKLCTPTLNEPVHTRSEFRDNRNRRWDFGPTPLCVFSQPCKARR